jgi:nucleoside-diphosphate-sugar epimerase
MFQVNVMESLRLWRMASEAGVRKWLIVGSSHEYGRSAERYAYIPSTAPLEPTSGYGASKAAATLAAVSMAIEKQISLTIVRPFNCYGEGQHAVNLWPSIRKAAMAGADFPMSSGRAIRDFIDVESVARSIVDLATDGRYAPVCTVKNLGTGQPMSVRDFVEFWWRHWNATGEILAGALPDREHEPIRFVADIG